ncbi:MAG: DNA polymerase III subunit delta, partial [Gammaproteobacteria bacterium]
RAQGEEAILVVWALAREVRTLTRISAELAKGQPEGLLFKQNGVWQNRIPAVRSALQRTSPADWRNRHSEVARLDRIVKGAEPGNIWVEIEKFVARLCGVNNMETV